MDKFEKKVKELAESVQLSQNERDLMRERLSEYLSYTPLPKHSAEDVATAVSRKRFSLGVLLRTRYALVALIITLSFGGVASAAEGSLPGDILYPVKVSINEELRAAVTFDAEAQAKWSVRRAERRLEEAQRLLAQGELDEERTEILRERFEEHVARVDAQIASFIEENPAVAFDIASQFEATLSAHGATLADGHRVQGGAPNTKREQFITQIQSKVAELSVRSGFVALDGKTNATAELKTEAQSSSSEPQFMISTDDVRSERSLVPQGIFTKEAAERILQSAEKKRSRARGRAEELGTKESEKTTAILLRVDTHIEEGERLVEEGLYKEAIIEGREALNILARVQVSLNTPVRLPVIILTPVNPSGADSDSDKEEETPLPPITAPDNTANNPLPIHRNYVNGELRLSGTLVVPSPCHTIRQEIVIAESFPEQVFIDFYIESTHALCAQVLVEKEFVVTARVDERASVRVRINGEPVEVIFSMGNAVGAQINTTNEEGTRDTDTTESSVIEDTKKQDTPSESTLDRIRGTLGL